MYLTLMCRTQTQTPVILAAMSQIMITIKGPRSAPDVGLIERLLSENPQWGCSRLSVVLCERWDWRAAACRAESVCLTHDWPAIAMANAVSR